MRDRSGTSVVEALVALLLGLLLMQAGMLAVGGARAHHQRLLERAEGLGAVRLTGTLLRLETSSGIPELDWTLSGDALSLRAFRGTGLMCGERARPDVIVVAYSGYRRPDPDKDSVQLVYPLGDLEAVGLRGFAPAPDASCGGSPLVDPVELSLTEAVAPGAVVARVFERGSYALTGGALRYRRGAGGRQPLTPELWEGPTGWRAGEGRLGAELVYRDFTNPMSTGTATGGVLRWEVPVAVAP